MNEKPDSSNLTSPELTEELRRDHSKSIIRKDSDSENKTYYRMICNKCKLLFAVAYEGIYFMPDGICFYCPVCKKKQKHDNVHARLLSSDSCTLL